MWCVGVAAVLVADRRVDGLASFTLEPGWNAVDMDLGKKMRWSVDGGAIGGGLSSDAPRLLGKGEGCRPGGVVGVPWVRHEAAADPQGCEARGRLSRRDARDRFDRRCLLFDVAGAFRDQPRRYRPRGRPGAFHRVLSRECRGYRVDAWVERGSPRSTTRREEWRLGGGVRHHRPTPSDVSLVGQRSAARCRAKLKNAVSYSNESGVLVSIYGLEGLIPDSISSDGTVYYEDTRFVLYPLHHERRACDRLGVAADSHHPCAATETPRDMPCHRSSGSRGESDRPVAGGGARRCDSVV